MPVIVATGTNGFIGANVLEKLLSLGVVRRGGRWEFEQGGRGLNVLCADLPDSRERPLARRFAGNPRVEFVSHTELEERIRRLPEPPLGVIHNGACSSTEETDLNVFRTLNVEFSQMLWRICTELRVPFLYASSASVYGDGSEGFSARKDAMSRLRPLSLYARSKYDFDLWAMGQGATPPTWFGLRYFNVYGRYESHKGRQASMVFHGFNQIRDTGKVRLYKSTDPRYDDGGQMRDFVWVSDLVDVTMQLLDIAWRREGDPARHPIAGEGAFVNLAPAAPRSFRDMMLAVFAAMGRKPDIEFIPMPEALAKQYQNYTCAELDTLREVGVTHSFTSLEDGVRHYVQEHLLKDWL